MPIPQRRQTTTTKQRKKPPPPNSSVTGPREDGFYLGNDIQTASQAWTTYVALLEWLAAHPSRKHSWGPSSGSSEEKAAQGRLRARRNLLWEAMLNSAKAAFQGREEEPELSLVHARAVEEAAMMSVLQQQFGVGISRLEAISQNLRKARASSSDTTDTTEPLVPSCTLLASLTEYCQKKNKATLAHIQDAAVLPTAAP